MERKKREREVDIFCLQLGTYCLTPSLEYKCVLGVGNDGNDIGVDGILLGYQGYISHQLINWL